MKKNLFTLLALCAFLLLPNIGKANEITVPNDPETPLTETSYLPIAISNSGALSSYNNEISLSQQLYFASELTGASSHIITAITFYYTSGPTPALNRKLRVWMKNSTVQSFAANVTPLVDPGTKVYSSKKGNVDNGVTLTSGSPYTLTFDTPFEWDGTSNLIVTVFDSSRVSNTTATKGQTKMFRTEGVGRYLHKTATAAYFDETWDLNNLTDMNANNSGDRGYVNKIKFTFEDEVPTAPGIPSNLAVSATTTTSATLSWSAVSGATSYDFQQSANGSDWSDLASGATGTSYNWTGLSAASTQYARIRATNAAGSSDWSDAVMVTTDAEHIHDGITFDKWSTSNALPTSGNYYIYDDVSFDAYASETITLTGNMNLCLNGNSVDIQASHIIIPDGKTLTIYDNVGTGSLSGFYESTPASAEGLITIENGGTLVIKEGSIQNLDVDPNDGYLAYAIYNKGTLRISGNPVISGHDADISLFNYKYITLDGALTNTTKYSVNAGGQTITSGWSTYMNGEKPSDYFESAKSGYDGICVVDNEAKLVKLLALDEDDDNDAISDGTYSGAICVSMTRSLTSSQYNTFCLPFALSAAQMEEYFGAGYDLEEFVSSSLEDDILNLSFNKATALVAGKPYLLQPAVDVENPVFEGVTIGAVSPADQTSDTYISFHGTFNPTSLEGGNRNLLFLGAGNELFWPAADGNIKGFRAYFEVKGAAQKNGIRARIVKKEDMATGFETVSGEGLPVTGKIILRNGQLFIIRDNKTYNAQGQLVK